MGAFPNLSQFVPVPGQKRTNVDKTGHFGTNWETPPFSIYPHLALPKENNFEFRVNLGAITL